MMLCDKAENDRQLQVGQIADMIEESLDVHCPSREKVSTLIPYLIVN